MTMNKQIKVFDAVQMMREIRDKISAETEHMTFEEVVRRQTVEKLAWYFRSVSRLEGSAR